MQQMEKWVQKGEVAPVSCSTEKPKLLHLLAPSATPRAFTPSPPYLGCKLQLPVLEGEAHPEVPGVPALAAGLGVQDTERCPALPCQLCLQQLLPLLGPRQLLLHVSREPGQGGLLAPQNHPRDPGRALQELPQLPVRCPECHLLQAGGWAFLGAASGQRLPQALGLGQGLLGCPGGSVPRGSPLPVPQLGCGGAVEDAASPWLRVAMAAVGWSRLREGLGSLELLFGQGGRQGVRVGLREGFPSAFPSAGLAGNEVGPQLSWGGRDRRDRADGTEEMGWDGIMG